MTRLITDEQILKIEQVLQDVTGLVECNCSIDGCEGDCTYACAVAGIATLNTLPVASQEAALKAVTPLGMMEATVHGDPDYPGIVLSIGPTQVAVLEYNSSGPAVQLHCWDGAQEDAVAHIAVTVEEPVLPQEAATGPQKPQEAAAAPVEAPDTCDRCGGSLEANMVFRGTSIYCSLDCADGKPQEAAAGAEWDAESRLSEIAELLDGVFEPLPKGGDEGDRTFIETAYIIAMGNRLCPAHRECLVADACTMGYAGCEANQ